MPRAMTQHSPGSLDQWLYFLTQGTVPNLHQINFFIFCVNKGLRFMLVYSNFHYLLEWIFYFYFFKVQRFPYFQDKTRSWVRSSVPLLNRNSWSEHDYSFKPFSGHNLFYFLMLINYNLVLTTPLLLLPFSAKRKRRQKNCFKIPSSTGIVVAHVIIANTPSRFFHLHLGTNSLSFDWDLLAFSFSNLFLISTPPPHPPSSSAAPF